ncbi:hypothetical protein WR25_13960, partial [Diploscapter pachys]
AVDQKIGLYLQFTSTAIGRLITEATKRTCSEWEKEGERGNAAEITPAVR